MYCCVKGLKKVTLCAPLLRAPLIGPVLLVQIVISTLHTLLHRGRNIPATLCRALIPAGRAAAAPAPILLGRRTAHHGAEIARDQVKTCQRYQENHQRRQEHYRGRADDYGTAKEIKLGQSHVEMVVTQDICLKCANKIRDKQVNSHAYQVAGLKNAVGPAWSRAPAAGSLFLHLWLLLNVVLARRLCSRSLAACRTRDPRLRRINLLRLFFCLRTLAYCREEGRHSAPG